MDTNFFTPEDIDAKPSEPIISRKALLEILDDRSTVVLFLQRQPYSCVMLSSWYNRKEYQGFGFSKVCYPDKWDAEQGAEIAKKRALYMIYHRIREYENEGELPF